MTLIAAFKCDHGVVICADTQETVDVPGRGSFRVSVSKIKPHVAGEYDVVMGGAGDAHLVDGFTRRLIAAIRSWPASLDDGAIEDKISAVLLDYHSKQVAATFHPDPLRFTVCLKGRNDPNISLWELQEVEIFPIDTYSLLGWDEEIYQYEVRWLYREPLRIAQAALLGIRLFSMAKNTSNCIGGHTQLIVVTENGMTVVDQEQVNTLEDRVETFNNAIARLVLELPDTSIDQEAFAAYLTKFKRLAMNTRESYIGEWRGRSLYRALFDPTWKGDTVQQNAPGEHATRTPLEDGKVIVSFGAKINLDPYEEVDDIEQSAQPSEERKTPSEPDE